MSMKTLFQLLLNMINYKIYSQNGGGKQPIMKAQYFIGENLDSCTETFRDEGWIKGSTMLAQNPMASQARLYYIYIYLF